MKLGNRLLRASTLVLTALVTVATVIPVSAQEFILHQRVTSSAVMGQEARDTTGKLYLGSQALRSEAEDGHDFILLLNERKLILLDHEQRIYEEMSFDEMERSAAQLAEEAADDPEAAQAMAMMRQLMGGGDGKVNFTDEGAGGTIAGFATRKYRITMAPTMEMEIWAAPDLKVPAAYYDAYQLMTPFNPILDMSQLLDALRKVDGVPLKSIMTMKMMGMEMTTTEEVTEVERTSIPASVFAVPAGYTKGELLGQHDHHH